MFSVRSNLLRQQRRGFTLIELLVVIAIIALLASLLLPAFAAARDRGKQMVCANNLRQISLLAVQYQNDYNGYLPAAWGGGAGAHDNACGESGTVQLEFYYSGVTSGATGNASYRMRIFLCPGDRRPNRMLALANPSSSSDIRDVSYGVNQYCWTKASGDVSKAIRPENIYPKNGARLGDVIMFGETDGGTSSGGGNPNNSYGSVLGYFMLNDTTTSFAAPTFSRLGTGIDWYLMFRHNSSRGMNLLYFDGHVGFDTDYAVNPAVNLGTLAYNYWY